MPCQLNDLSAKYLVNELVCQQNTELPQSIYTTASSWLVWSPDKNAGPAD